MQKAQSLIHSAAIISGLSHIFCCGVPLVVAALSLMMGVGILSFLPFDITELHAIIHAYEQGIISISAAILLLGWGLHFISRRIDCHDTGCMHPPCEPKKRNSARVLTLATLLFLINIIIYMASPHYAFEGHMHVAQAANMSDIQSSHEHVHP